jgi:hypothetical protein
MRNAYKILTRNLKGRKCSGGPGVDRMIILEMIVGKQGGKVGSGFIWLRMRTSAELF